MTESSTKSSAASLAVKAIVALAVTALTLAWAFSGVELDRLRADLAETSGGVVLMFVGAHVVMHAARTVRWGLLIRPLGASWRLAFASFSVGIPAAFFVPLRLGELVRPAMCARAGVPLGGAVAAVAVERIADGIVNVGIFFALSSLMASSSALPPEVVVASRFALVGFGGGVAFLVATYFAREPMVRVVRAVFAPLSPAIGERVANLATTFVDGLASMRSLPRFLGFLATTAIYWGVNGAATWMLARTFVASLDAIAGAFTVAVTVFAVAIPAAPGFAGTLEAGYRLGLAPFGVDAHHAAVVAVVAHGVQLVFMGAVAGIGALFAPRRAETEG